MKNPELAKLIFQMEKFQMTSLKDSFKATSQIGLKQKAQLGSVNRAVFYTPGLIRIISFKLRLFLCQFNQLVGGLEIVVLNNTCKYFSITLLQNHFQRFN